MVENGRLWWGCSSYTLEVPLYSEIDPTAIEQFCDFSSVLRVLLCPNGGFVEAWMFTNGHAQTDPMRPWSRFYYPFGGYKNPQSGPRLPDWKCSRIFNNDLMFRKLRKASMGHQRCCYYFGQAVSGHNQARFRKIGSVQKKCYTVKCQEHMALKAGWWHLHQQSPFASIA